MENIAQKKKTVNRKAKNKRATLLQSFLNLFCGKMKRLQMFFFIGSHSGGRAGGTDCCYRAAGES